MFSFSKQNIFTSILRAMPFSKQLKAASTNYNDAGHADVADAPVIPSEKGSVGFLMLNRPKFMNALNLEMLSIMTSKLIEWEKEVGVKAIIMKSSKEKYFCAGGDMKAILDTDILQNDLPFKTISTEYSMVHLISLLSTPCISLMYGITMGAGIGICNNCQYRIATDSTVCAVPETAIGFFPDVGATFYLPRLPEVLGMYLGLTGNTITGRDVVTSGLATHFIPSDRIESFERELTEINSSEDVKSVVAKYCSNEDTPFHFEQHWDNMCHAFSALTVEGILNRLRELGDEWSSKTREKLLRMSPTALKVTHRALIIGSQFTLKDCLRMECNLSLNFLRQPDVFEGVRSVLVEKREAGSNWKPPTLEEVTSEAISSYFLGNRGREITFYQNSDLNH